MARYDHTLDLVEIETQLLLTKPGIYGGKVAVKTAQVVWGGDNFGVGNVVRVSRHVGMVGQWYLKNAVEGQQKKKWT